MNLHEAHQVLGIDETVAAEPARRAYLKLLKKHRPESDPEGFQRIREAHELVAQHRSMFAHRFSSQGDSGVAAHGEVATREVVALPGMVDELPAIPQFEPEVQWLDRVRDEFEREKLCSRVTDWGAFFAHCLLDCPDSDDAWELYYEIEEDEPLAAELLRAASEAGLAGFEDSLVLMVPQLATEQELVAVADSGRAASTLFAVFLAAGDLERAGPAALRALELEAGSEISGYRLLDLLFSLEASGSEQGGPLLFEKINEHIMRRLDERELFGNCVTSWILANEYFAACARLSPAGRVFVGGVCRELDWERASQLAMNWRPAEPLTRARVVPSVRSVLSGHAPTLFGILFPDSSAGGEAPPVVESTRSSVPWWTILVIVFGGIRLLRGCVPDEPNVDHSNRARELVEEIAHSSPGDQLRNARETGTTPPPVRAGDEVVQDGWFDLRDTSVATFHRAALGGDCEQMERALANLSWYQKRAPDDAKEQAAAENGELGKQYSEQCEKTKVDDEQE